MSSQGDVFFRHIPSGKLDFNNRDLDIDYIFDTSESSTSQSSSSVEGPFKAHVPFVLELHDIKKDDPPPLPALQPIGSPTVKSTIPKIKKHKKKKKVPDANDTSQISLSADSLSDASSVAPSSIELKEEFYDAHESYHVIPENQIPVALAARMVGHSETNQNPKAPELTQLSEPQTPTPVTHDEPSPVTKPTLPP